jgi:hypothetical protein
VEAARHDVPRVASFGETSPSSVDRFMTALCSKPDGRWRTTA